MIHALGAAPIGQRYECLEHPEGRTHFQLAGPAHGDLVVFVNGATLPLDVWAPILPPLHALGYRTLCFDLAGRGFSTPFRARPSIETDIRQIERLTTHIGVRSGVHMVGLASGALSCAAYAVQQKDVLEAVALVAPDGVATHFTFAEQLTLAPVVGEALMRVVGRRSILKRASRYSPREDVQQFVRDLLTFGLSSGDYLPAVLRYVRALPLRSGEALYARLAASGVPVRVIWGALDQITPVSAADLMRTHFGQKSVSIVEDVGHLPHVERPGQIANLLHQGWAHLTATPVTA